jgi:hypothetical protein
MRIASAAQRISKIEKSARNQSAYASAQKQQVVARSSAERSGRELLAFCANVINCRHCDVRMLVRRESGYLRKGQRIHRMGQSQRSKFLTNRIIRVPIAHNL